MKFNKFLTDKTNTKHEKILDDNQEIYRHTVETFYASQQIEEDGEQFLFGDVNSKKDSGKNNVGGFRNRKLRLITSLVACCLLIVLSPIIISLIESREPDNSYSNVNVVIEDYNHSTSETEEFEVAPSVSITDSGITAGNKSFETTDSSGRDATPEVKRATDSASGDVLYYLVEYSDLTQNGSASVYYYINQGYLSSVDGASAQAPNNSPNYDATPIYTTTTINNLTVRYTTSVTATEFSADARITLSEGTLSIHYSQTPTDDALQNFLNFLEDNIKGPISD